MGRYQKLISFFAFSVLMLGLTVVASAQYRNRRGNNDNYGYQDISPTIKSLRNSARQFEKTLDRELDRSRYDGSKREDFLNNLAGKFKNAAEDLDDEYEGSRKMGKSSDEARRVLNTASQLDNALFSSRVGQNNYTIMNGWTSIERQLWVIARAYNLNYNGRYGRNGNRGNNGRYGRNDGRYGRDDDRYGRNDDRYGRNDGRYGRDDDRYGRNDGRYGNIGPTISNLKYKAKALEDTLDRDRYDRNGSNLEGLSDRFKNAVDDLYKEYQDRDGGYDEVQRVLNIGEQLDREISRNRVGRGVRNDWNSIERDLRTLANAYNVSYRGNNGAGWKISDIFRNFPF